MDLGLRELRALVGGASSGLGTAVAEALSAEGAVVAVTARRPDLLKEVAERIGGHPIVGDLVYRSKTGAPFPVAFARQALHAQAGHTALVDLGQHVLLETAVAGVEGVQRHLCAIERVVVRQHLEVDGWVFVAREADEAHFAGLFRIVQRLDKETSGLIVFARTVVAERALGKQFRDHTVVRRYIAIAAGKVASQRIATSLVRDRGDGRRGSVPADRAPQEGGQQAVTHVRVVEELEGIVRQKLGERG